MKKVTVITGHYGSGKTNVAVNFAAELARQGEKVSAADLDIVNPYFRTADFKELFGDLGVTLVASVYANSNLDIPALSFDLERICREEGYVLIDVGGDDSGAFALGRYKQVFDELAARGDLDVLYVINKYRYLTSSPEEAVQLMYEIEQAARVRHTGIINNSNLGCETTFTTAADSLEFAEKVCRLTGLPLEFTSVPENSVIPEELKAREKFREMKVYVKPIWEQ